MTLETIIFDILPGIWFWAAGDIADAMTTYLSVCKMGLDAETNPQFREKIKNEGIVQATEQEAFTKICLAAATASTLYAADCLLGTSGQLLSLNHCACYAIGSTRFLAAANNLARYYNFDRVANVLVFLPEYFNKACFAIGNFFVKIGMQMQEHSMLDDQGMLRPDILRNNP